MTSPWKFAAILAASAMAAASPAAAGESGEFASIGGFVRDYTEIDHAGGTVVGGSIDGAVTVTESSGEPFAVGAHSNAMCVVYGKTSDAGIDLEAPCALTDADGDKLYLVSRRGVGDVEAGGGGVGAMTLEGGTGKYAGLSGSCDYETDYLPGDRLVTQWRCAWERDGGE